MSETRYDVSCPSCGTLIGWSYNSQLDAEDNAWETGEGVNDSRFGGWRCMTCYEKEIQKLTNPRDDYCLTEEYAYDTSVSHLPGVTLTIQTARKTHSCSHRPYCQIRPGQVYIRQSVAPWTMIADDVDEEGRTIGAPNGEWSIAKYHRFGDEHNQDLRPAAS